MKAFKINSSCSSRITSMRSYLFFVSSFSSCFNNLFNSFFYFSFFNKSLFGEKFISKVLLESVLYEYFEKFNSYINRIMVIESSFMNYVFIEFYSLKLNIQDFNSFIFILKRNFTSLFLDKKPVQFFFKELNSIISANKNNFLHFSSNLTFTRHQPIFLLLVETGFVGNFWSCAKLFSKVVSLGIQRSLKHSHFLSFLDQLLHSLYNLSFSNFNGLRVEIRGRISSSDKTQTRVLCHGSLPIHKVSDNLIDFGFSSCITSYGTFGVRVYFSYL